MNELNLNVHFVFKLENVLEKCKTLNTAIEKIRKELESAKERGSKFSELVIKHEQSLSLTTTVRIHTHIQYLEFEFEIEFRFF